MAGLVTHIICIGIGALLLGPLGAILGFTLAWYINWKASTIEAEWQRSLDGDDQ